MQNSDIEKCILIAASEDEFIWKHLETFLHGCFSKAAANINSFEVMLKRNEFL